MKCGRRLPYNSLQVCQELSHENLNLLFPVPETEIGLRNASWKNLIWAQHKFFKQQKQPENGIGSLVREGAPCWVEASIPSSTGVLILVLLQHLTPSKGSPETDHQILSHQHSCYAGHPWLFLFEVSLSFTCGMNFESGCKVQFMCMKNNCEVNWFITGIGIRPSSTWAMFLSVALTRSNNRNSKIDQSNV